MKRLFKIQGDHDQEGGNKVLLCDFSNYHICYAVADVDAKKITDLSYFESVSPITAANVVETLSDESLDESPFSKTVISSGFPQVSIVPASIFQKENAGVYLQGTGTQLNDPVFFDNVNAQNATVVYALPQMIADEFKNSESVAWIHSYTPILKNRNEQSTGDLIHVQFNRKEINVIVFKNGKLQLAQTYAYAAPLDVVYYLLAMCNQYGLSQSATVIELAGLVDENSAMYKELYQYFSNMVFAQANQFSFAESEFPQHFFSSIFNLAACVL